MESHTNNNNTTNLRSTQRSNKATTASNPLLQAMAREKNVEEKWRGPVIAEAVLEPTDMFLVLPSYAEPHKQAIKNIVAAEKAKLCSNSLFKACFENIDFKIAFANSKNIKQMVVRTKI